jgi:hypothetical protein
MEYWSIGSNHHSTTPSLHYSSPMHLSFCNSLLGFTTLRRNDKRDEGRGVGCRGEKSLVP